MTGTWESRLREAITADGRSLRAISIACGYGPNYLSDMFRNQKEPSINNLMKLCSELQVSVVYVLTGVEVTSDAEKMYQALMTLTPAQRLLVDGVIRELQKAGQ